MRHKTPLVICRPWYAIHRHETLQPVPQQRHVFVCIHPPYSQQSFPGTNRTTVGSLSFYLSLYLFISLPVSLSICAPGRPDVYFYLYISGNASVSVFLCLSLPVFFPLSASACLSVCLYIFPSLAVSLSFLHCIYLCISLRISLCISACLCKSVFLFPSLSVFV